MKWKEEYATGIQRVDDQHRMIFRMADDYDYALKHDVGEEAYGVLLEFLDGYCRDHFSFEEGCMDKYRCSVAQKNKDAHVVFLEMLEDYRQRFKTKGFQPTDARELIGTLYRWLEEHICGIDVHLKKCVKKQT